MTRCMEPYLSIAQCVACVLFLASGVPGKRKFGLVLANPLRKSGSEFLVLACLGHKHGTCPFFLAFHGVASLVPTYVGRWFLVVFRGSPLVFPVFLGCPGLALMVPVSSVFRWIDAFMGIAFDYGKCFGAFCLDVRTFTFCQRMGFPLNHEQLLTFSRASQISQLSVDTT